jgi:DNA-binding GntR family transcriptional regulator
MNMSADGIRAEGSELPVRRLQRATLNEEVYAELKRAIMAGAVEPGRSMTIRSLAAAFGVSLMPVREALGRLVAERALELLPNRSVAVPVIDHARFREITRIRLPLERMAAEEGARRLDQEAKDLLAHWNAQMEIPAVASSAEALELNRQIHFTLYAASAMPTLTGMIESLWLQIGPLLNLHMRGLAADRSDLAQIHHRAMLAALAKGDAEAVGRAIVADIETAALTIEPCLP